MEDQMEGLMLQAQRDIENGKHPKLCPSCGSPNAYYEHAGGIEPFWGCDDCTWQAPADKYLQSLI